MFKNRNPELEHDDARIAINQRIEEVAKKRGASMAQVALAWCLAQPAVTAPIVGTTRIEALDELVGEWEGEMSNHRVISVYYCPHHFTADLRCYPSPPHGRGEGVH
jgi:aryl-alcohol dehydrogenase-like predicted oxidoreductase